MAVPKRKTSKSKRNMRRSHHALTPVNVCVDNKTGEYRLPHHVCLTTGRYNDRVVVKRQETEGDNREEQAYA